MVCAIMADYPLLDAHATEATDIPKDPLQPRAPHDLQTSVRYLLHAFWKLVLITQYKNTPSLNRYGSLGVFFSYTELSVFIVSYISR